MKIASVFFAVLALVAGLVAAAYWRKASKVFVVPVYPTPTGLQFAGPEEASLWVRAFVDSMQKAGRLNKIAAQWTALAVAFGTAASVLGILP